ncbi:hypothetical protein [Bacillus chungangensis]|uniref:Negative regulator of genetic competence, sporulation and motility n=1 Tax=Bacillus chungangensis TaxID=587633 RepID=A0ABT9WVE9_9BACI|nr:hypothetical protein [Bacillus chungangensis]MDQ0176745.1 negative regulator of genetic competence, sporulation and motility [Bacillus chungangensis]
MPTIGFEWNQQDDIVGHLQSVQYKSFILYENEAYYYNNVWVNLGAIPDDAEAKKQLFEQYGMEHDITGQQLKEFKKMLLTNNGE